MRDVKQSSYRWSESFLRALASRPPREREFIVRGLPVHYRESLPEDPHRWTANDIFNALLHRADLYAHLRREGLRLDPTKYLAAAYQRITGVNNVPTGVISWNKGLLRSLGRWGSELSELNQEFGDFTFDLVEQLLLPLRETRKFGIRNSFVEYRFNPKTKCIVFLRSVDLYTKCALYLFGGRLKSRRDHRRTLATLEWCNPLALLYFPVWCLVCGFVFLMAGGCYMKDLENAEKYVAVDPDSWPGRDTDFASTPVPIAFEDVMERGLIGRAPLGPDA
jgi:hypothetical protein